MQHAYKTSELQPEDRTTVERLLGRPLGSDEFVEIVARSVSAPSADENRARREEAGRAIRALRKDNRLGGLSLRDLVNEGRRV